jgi:hypothetical protein
VIRRAMFAAAALTLALATWAVGGSAAPGAPSQRTTFLLSSANGSLPNGPSRSPAISHDQRIARYIAYESDASNIVVGDTNGTTDVFLVSRARPFGETGTPWRPARTQLISRARDGSPANGPSYKPSVDGDSHHAPRCVAFVSAASNLVAGDTNGEPDGFVYHTRTRRITRVTVDSAGRQANGSTYDISISGDCKRVAFTSDATNLALTRSDNPAWSDVRTKGVQAPTPQVYVHFLSGSGLDTGFRRLTFLASAAADGTPGNGGSSEPALARSGKAVVFNSTATNLVQADATPTSDVYIRTISRKFRRLANGHGVQTLRGRLALVSATASGQAGNGPSQHPTVTDDTRHVAFETDASDLLPDDANGVTDIVRADMKSGGPPTLSWVSKTPVGGIANGASHHPVISDAGEFVLFDSGATNLRPTQYHHLDSNGVQDVFLWNARTLNVSLESRDAQNGFLSSASEDPVTSSRGNYVLFESADPLIDLPLAQRLFPSLAANPAALSAQMARAAANAGEQVYLRYLGPK